MSQNLRRRPLDHITSAYGLDTITEIGPRFPRRSLSLTLSIRRPEARIASGPSLKHVVYDWLSRTPVDGVGHEGVDRFLRRFLDTHVREGKVRLDRATAQAITPADVERLRERYESEAKQAEDRLLALAI